MEPSFCNGHNSAANSDKLYLYRLNQSFCPLHFVLFFVFSNQVLLQPRSISQPEDTLHLHLHSSIMNHFLPLFHSAIFLRKTLKRSASDKSLLKSSARKFIDLRVKLNLEHLPVICVTKLHNPRWAFRVVQDTERERAQVRQKHH